MRRLALLILVYFAACGVTATATAATLGPRYLGGPGARSKPPSIGVGAKGGWERLRWSRWGKAEATARGIYDIAGFAGEPGTGYRGRVFVKVSRRKRCPSGALVYTRVRYRLRKPIGGRRLFRERFSTCPTPTIRGAAGARLRPVPPT